MKINNREKANKLFDENIHLAYDFYHKKKNNVNVEREDLLQECLKSLWIASLNYNKDKGYEFSTLAYKIMSNKIIDLLKKDKNIKKIYYEESSNHDKIIDGDKDILGSELMGEPDLNIDLALEDIDNKHMINNLKKIYGEDVESVLLFTKLKGSGYDIPNIKIIMNCSDKDIEKIRRKLRIMKKNSHNLTI